MKTATAPHRMSKKTVHAYIIGQIDWDGYELEQEPQTDAEKLAFLADNFRRWLCPYELKQNGTYQGAFAYWLAGLPGVINLPVYYCDILKLAEQLGSYPPAFATWSEKKREQWEDKICANFYNFIAANCLRLFNKHGIKYTI